MANTAFFGEVRSNMAGNRTCAKSRASRLRGEACASIQHVPGDGSPQPLLGAVRTGRSDGQHAAVPWQCGDRIRSAFSALVTAL